MWQGVPKVQELGAARTIPEVLDLGVEEADNESPKFWTWSRGRRRDLGSSRVGGLTNRSIGALLLTRVGTQSLLSIRPPTGSRGVGLRSHRQLGIPGTRRGWAPSGSPTAGGIRGA